MIRKNPKVPSHTRRSDGDRFGGVRIVEKSERVTLRSPLLLGSMEVAQDNDGCGALLASHARASSSLRKTLVS